MTRPKVDPDKRQRTACACDSCKRRKQKCNGKKPCNTCTKRQLVCEYKTSESSDHDFVASPTKRRHLDSSPRPLRSSLDDALTSRPPSAPWGSVGATGGPKPEPAGSLIAALAPTKPVRYLLNTDETDSDSRSKMSNASGAADEAEVYEPQWRMLQDSTGRLLYVGDSASLSYLQWIRIIVDGVSGPSEFTQDPRRHMIMEANLSLPPSSAPNGVLPDRRTADILLDAYFVNTTGLVEVFDRTHFRTQVNECYDDPLNVEPSVLCTLYMVFAIGLVLARPTVGSEDEAAIGRLRADKKVNRAEFFFRNAKSLADPVSGFEDADFWSIQALLLMSLYMLSVSKRNASYAYYGMAVRSAFSLGLHREECDIIFNPVQRKTRRNLWRTLFVLDRFLAAALGRPAAISEDDCSDHALDAPGQLAGGMRSPAENEHINTTALDATVRTCRVVGRTLKEVYSKRRISTGLAQEIAAELEPWTEALDPMLHWRQAMGNATDRSQCIAILHVNLFQCHSVVLLTRPFFLFMINKAREEQQQQQQQKQQHPQQQQQPGSGLRAPRINQKMEKFAQTCVEASQHTLILAKAILDAEYLPQCNPFVIHFVFAAGLIIFSNEFAALYHNPEAEQAIQNCKAILRYCAPGDPQAERVLWIVEAFDQANKSRAAGAAKLALPGRKAPFINTSSRIAGYDPMAHFFTPPRPGSQQQQQPPQQSLPSLPPMIKHEQPAGPGGGGAPPSSSSSSGGGRPPVRPSVRQQPSPEGSRASPVNTGAASAGLHGLDPLSAPEAEFDFDSLWPANWQTTAAGPVPMPHHYHHHHHHHNAHPAHPAHLAHAGEYSAYDLGQPPVALSDVLGGAVNVPLYPASDFR